MGVAALLKTRRVWEKLLAVILEREVGKADKGKDYGKDEGDLDLALCLYHDLCLNLSSGRDHNPDLGHAS